MAADDDAALAAGDAKAAMLSAARSAFVVEPSVELVMELNLASAPTAVSVSVPLDCTAVAEANVPPASVEFPIDPAACKAVWMFAERDDMVSVMAYETAIVSV